MAEVVRMPKLSDTMTEGVVAEWHKKVGDEVSSGELLAEIETDKATMEFESFYDGVLLHIGVDKGAAAPVNDILAIIGDKGEDVKKILAEDAANQPEEKVEEAPAPKEEAKKEEAPAPSPTPAPSAAPKPTTVSKSAQTKPSNGKVVASPLARKLAEERSINLVMVKGTGEGGRIVKRDIDNYNGGGGFVAVESFTDETVSQMRKAIARRLGESKFTAPHFYLTISIDMDAAMEARKGINKHIAPAKISFNDIVVKAAAKALVKNPGANAAWYGDFIRYNDHVHIGVAVAVDEGLLVPVVPFADGKTLTQIGEEVKDFATRAKAKKLQPDEMEGSTFTISNLGMFGIEEFTAIINPPNSCILAVGGINQVPVVKDGQIVPGNVMKVTLSCDHRVVDGAVGSAFLQTFKQYMENPVLLLGETQI